MTEEKKIALINSMAGKKVSELTLEERTLYDAEFKYSFFSSDNPSGTKANSTKLLDVSNLPSTMDFLAARV